MSATTVALIVMMFTACDSATNDHPSPPSPTTNNLNSTVTPSNSTENNDIVTNAKKTLKIGMSKSDIKKTIIGAYKEIISDNPSLIWRYDFVKDGYNFEPKGLPDDVDLEGLKNGSMKQQFFIYWNGENLSGYVLYYQNKDGKVEEYRMLENGDIKTKTF